MSVVLVSIVLVSVVLVSGTLVSVIMPNVVLVSAVWVSGTLVSVVMLNVVAPFAEMEFLLILFKAHSCNNSFLDTDPIITSTYFWDPEYKSQTLDLDGSD